MTAYVFALLSLGEVEAQIRVVESAQLFDEFKDTNGFIPGTTAAFGAPWYGQTFMGDLVLMQPKGQKSKCTAEDYHLGGDGTGDAEITIAVTRRGLCPFTRLAAIAQEKGASAVIFVDEAASTYTREGLQQVVVGDDGQGAEVTIPSVLVTNQDGEKLISAEGEVRVELSWRVARPDSLVAIDLWMDAGEERASTFLKEFKDDREVLNAMVSFQPHFNVFSLDPSSYDASQRLCLDASAGLCAEDPDGTGPVTGADVLQEAVRQLCVRELTAPAGGVAVDGPQWWDYVARLADACPINGTGPDQFGGKCSSGVLAEVGLDLGQVETCVRDKAEEYLKRERDNRAWASSALTINGWRFMGMLDARLVTMAVCTGFIREPSQCGSIVQELVVPGPLAFKKRLDVSWIVLAGIAGVFVVCAGLFFYSQTAQAPAQGNVALEIQAELGTYSQMQGSDRW